MGSQLFPEAYEELINEDIAWLEKNSPSELERGHIVAVLQQSVKEYRERGYMEAMCHEGPIYGDKDSSDDSTEGEEG